MPQPPGHAPPARPVSPPRRDTTRRAPPPAVRRRPAAAVLGRPVYLDPRLTRHTWRDLAAPGHDAHRRGAAAQCAHEPPMPEPRPQRPQPQNIGPCGPRASGCHSCCTASTPAALPSPARKAGPGGRPPARAEPTYSALTLARLSLSTVDRAAAAAPRGSRCWRSGALGLPVARAQHWLQGR